MVDGLGGGDRRLFSLGCEAICERLASSVNNETTTTLYAVCARARDDSSLRRSVCDLHERARLEQHSILFRLYRMHESWDRTRTAPQATVPRRRARC